MEREMSFFRSERAHLGTNCLMVEVYRSHAIRYTQKPIRLLWTSDQLVTSTATSFAYNYFVSFDFILYHCIYVSMFCVLLFNFVNYVFLLWLSRYSDWATGWTVRGSNPGGARFFARPDRPWGPPSLLYNGYRVFSGGKLRPGRAADHSPLLAPWSWKSRAIPLPILWATIGPVTGTLYLFTIYIFLLLCYVFLLLYLRILLMCLSFWVFCFIVLFCVLFVCKCVLYYCHRVSTQLQLKNI